MGVLYRIRGSVVDSCSENQAAEPAHWSVSGRSDHPAVHDHGLPAGGQLLGEGRPAGDQLQQTQDRSLRRQQAYADAQSQVGVSLVVKLRFLHADCGARVLGESSPLDKSKRIAADSPNSVHFEAPNCVCRFWSETLQRLLETKIFLSVED